MKLRSLRGALVVACAVFVFGSQTKIVSAQVVPKGDKQRLEGRDSYTCQYWPRIATGPTNGFLVVWSEPYWSDGNLRTTSPWDDLPDAFGQTLSRDGAIQGEAFELHPEPPDDIEAEESQASVASLPDGRFVVVWKEKLSPPGVPAIVGRFFQSDGTPLGDSFRVNSANDTWVSLPDITVSPNGRWLVVWKEGESGSDYLVHARLFESDGMPVGEPFIVSDLGIAEEPWRDRGVVRVTTLTHGEFVVVWESLQSHGDDQSGTSIQLRRISSVGTPLGAEAQVNTTTQGDVERPKIASQPNNAFVVIWEHPETDTVFGRRFGGDGLPVSDEVALAESPPDPGWTTWHKMGTGLATDADGTFVLSWCDSYEYLAVQHFSPSGDPIGDKFVVDEAGYGHDNADIASNHRGDFVVVWERAPSWDPMGFGRSVYLHPLKRLDVFDHGFESGGVEAWGPVTAVSSCQPARRFTCEGPLDRTRNSGPGTTKVVTSYPCMEAPEQAMAEMVYAFTAPENGNYEVRLTATEANLNLVVLSGSDCDPANCLVGSANGPIHEDLSFYGAAGQDYLIVVDGNPGAESEYLLELICP